jgi:hypothetical protein
MFAFAASRTTDRAASEWISSVHKPEMRLRRGKWILLSRTLTSLVTLALLMPLSLRFGILGGARAIAVGMSVGTATIIPFASRVDRIGRVQGGP